MPFYTKIQHNFKRIKVTPNTSDAIPPRLSPSNFFVNFSNFFFTATCTKWSSVFFKFEALKIKKIKTSLVFLDTNTDETLNAQVAPPLILREVLNGALFTRSVLASSWIYFSFIQMETVILRTTKGFVHTQLALQTNKQNKTAKNRGQKNITAQPSSTKTNLYTTLA